MLLYTLCAAVIFTNLLLFFIYYGGSDGLLFAWIPLQTGIITITFLLNTEISLENLLNTLYFNVGSHLIPVVFLMVFVIGIGKGKENERPNYVFIWGIAICVLVIALAALYLFQNTSLLLICSVLSIFLNFFNIQTITFNDNDNIKVTWLYVTTCNVFTVICIYGLDLLVLNGYEKFAAVISSVPLISVMVLAQSTYTDPGKQITLRQILMLAAQIWPSTCYVGITIICLEMEWINSIIIPSVGSFGIVSIQYILFTRKKHSYNPLHLKKQIQKTEINQWANRGCKHSYEKINSVKYNFVHRENLQF